MNSQESANLRATSETQAPYSNAYVAIEQRSQAVAQLRAGAAQHAESDRNAVRWAREDMVALQHVGAWERPLALNAVAKNVDSNRAYAGVIETEFAPLARELAEKKLQRVDAAQASFVRPFEVTAVHGERRAERYATLDDAAKAFDSRVNEPGSAVLKAREGKVLAEPRWSGDGDAQPTFYADSTVRSAVERARAARLATEATQGLDGASVADASSRRVLEHRAQLAGDIPPHTMPVGMAKLSARADLATLETIKDPTERSQGLAAIGEFASRQVNYRAELQAAAPGVAKEAVAAYEADMAKVRAKDLRKEAEAQRLGIAPLADRAEGFIANAEERAQARPVAPDQGSRPQQATTPGLAASTEVDGSKAKDPFEMRRAELRARLESSFTRVGDAYVSLQGGRDAFREEGGKLTTNDLNSASLRAMVDAAEVKGWTQLRVGGSEAFQRAAFIEAASRGLNVYTETYRVTNEDRKLVAELATARGEDRSPLAGLQRAAAKDAAETGPKPAEQAPVGTVERAGVSRQASPEMRDIQTHLHQASQQPSPPDKASKGQDFTGVLVAHGRAPYQNLQDNAPSYYAVVQDADGTRKTAWGLGLPKALEDARANLGDEITLNRVGQHGVTVPVVVKDGTGQAQTVGEKPAQRAEWAAVVITPARDTQERSEGLRDREIVTGAAHGAQALGVGVHGMQTAAKVVGAADAALVAADVAQGKPVRGIDAAAAAASLTIATDAGGAVVQGAARGVAAVGTAEAVQRSVDTSTPVDVNVPAPAVWANERRRLAAQAVIDAEANRPFTDTAPVAVRLAEGQVPGRAPRNESERDAAVTQRDSPAIQAVRVYAAEQGIAPDLLAKVVEDAKQFQQAHARAGLEARVPIYDQTAGQERRTAQIVQPAIAVTRPDPTQDRGMSR